MNGSIVGRLIWKEYRLQRGFWLSILGLTLLLESFLIFVAWVEAKPPNVDTLFAIALAAPALYIMGCGTTLFAGEHESETYDFQSALPVTAARMLTGKILFAVASGVVLWPLVWLAAWALAGGQLPEASWHTKIRSGSVLLMFELLAWSVFFSLVLRRVLWAAIGSGIMVFAVSLVLTGLPFLGQEPSGPVERYVATLPLRAAVAGVVLIAAVWIGRHWFDQYPRGLARFAEALCYPFAWRSARESHRPMPLRRYLVALIWHQWRQARAMIGGMYLVTVLASLWALVDQRQGGPTSAGFLAFALPVLSSVFGSCAFMADQRNGQYRFFAEHGVRPRLVWISRQLVWAGAAVPWAIVAIAGLLSLDRDSGRTVALAAGLAILTFAVGQSCSMLIRSAPVAVVSGLTLSFVAVLWAGLMYQLGVPILLSVAPIPAVLLGVTWLRAGHWIHDTTTWFARLRLAGSLVVPLLALLIAVAAYRAFEIPLVEVPLDLAEVERSPTPEERETDRMYEQAWLMLKASERPQLEPDEGTGKGEATRNAEEAESIEQGIETFLAATRRETFRIPNPSGLLPRWMIPPGLVTLIDGHAKRLEESGQLDRALELYVGLIRLARHSYQQPTMVNQVLGIQVERRVMERLPEWAAREGQTVESIRKAMDELSDLQSRIQPNWQRGVAGDYLLARRVAMLDESALSAFGVPTTTMFHFAMRFMPWERARVLRLLRVQAIAELVHFPTLQHKLQRNEILPTPGQQDVWHVRLAKKSAGPERNRVRVSSLQIDRWLRTTPLLQFAGLQVNLTHSAMEMSEHVVRQRAVRAQLALIAWRTEHGQLPDSLEQLVGHGLGELPIDPFTGDPLMYFREGLPATLPPDQLEDLAPLVPGQPFLWSPGHYVEEWSYWRDRSMRDLPGQMRFDRGLRFPIPPPQTPVR